MISSEAVQTRAINNIRNITYYSVRVTPISILLELLDDVKHSDALISSVSRKERSEHSGARRPERSQACSNYRIDSEATKCSECIIHKLIYIIVIV